MTHEEESERRLSLRTCGGSWSGCDEAICEGQPCCYRCCSLESCSSVQGLWLRPCVCHVCIHMIALDLTHFEGHIQTIKLSLDHRKWKGKHCEMHGAYSTHLLQPGTPSMQAFLVWARM